MTKVTMKPGKGLPEPTAPVAVSATPVSESQVVIPQKPKVKSLLDVMKDDREYEFLYKGAKLLVDR